MLAAVRLSLAFHCLLTAFHYIVTAFSLPVRCLFTACRSGPIRHHLTVSTCVCVR